MVMAAEAPTSPFETPWEQKPLRDVFAEELGYLVNGYNQGQSAELQNTTPRIIQGRRKEIKRFFKTKTLKEAIVASINTGYVAIDIDEEAEAPRLSPREENVLRLVARGWSQEKIGQRYHIRDNTVSAHYENIRKKLGARSTTHSILRAFELNIFTVGEEVLDPDEARDLQNKGLELTFDTTTFKPHELGIESPREVEILGILGSVATRGAFRKADIYAGGFYDEAVSKNARAHAFSHAIMGVIGKLEEAVGQPVIEEHGHRAQTTYVVVAPFAINQAGKTVNIPEGSTVAENSSTKTRKASTAAQKIARQVQPRTAAKPKPQPVNKSAQKKELTRADIDRISARTHVNGTRVVGTPKPENGFVVVKLESKTDGGPVEEGSEKAKAIIDGFRKSKKRSFRTEF
jgi:DNA-binding CsgD family transcriptional regulator